MESRRVKNRRFCFVDSLFFGMFRDRREDIFYTLNELGMIQKYMYSCKGPSG